jgi:hypothetical protein
MTTVQMKSFHPLPANDNHNDSGDDNDNDNDNDDDYAIHVSPANNQQNQVINISPPLLHIILCN